MIMTDRSHRNDFIEIMEMLDKRLNDKGKNWRHVFKVRLALCYTIVVFVLISATVLDGP